jgi:hypothetical protein
MSAGRIRLTIFIVLTLVVGGVLPGLIASADGVAGAPFGSLDVVRAQPGGALVSGWAIDPNTTAPINVHVYVDGKVVRGLVANIARSDLARTYPGRGIDHGYSTSVTMAAGTHTVCVYAINVGAGAGNPQLGCKAVAVGGSPIGRLDVVSQISGGVALQGWALDRDTTAPITVHVYVDGVVIEAVTANTNRPDIAAAYPGYGAAHGYTANLTLADGTHTICIYAINVGPAATNPNLGCKAITLHFSPFGSLDAVRQIPGGISVAGWAMDPDEPTTPISIDTYADGVFLGRVTANGSRPDVAKVYPGYGPAHGYSATFTLAEGLHTICEYALNVGPGSSNPQLGCRALTLNFSPTGSFDSVTRSSAGTTATVGGWTFDSDSPTTSISVAISLDGGTATDVVANGNRPDIARVYPSAGAHHGFTASMAVSDTEHTICITALNIQFGGDTELGCRILNATHVVKPGAATAVTAVGGYGGAVVTWVTPTTDGGAPITFTVTASPGGAHSTVPNGSTQATVMGLAAGAHYSFSVVATNIAGSSPVAVSNTITTTTAPPPQTTAPPISTSRYIRNITGAASDATTLRAEGVADATANPSGHGYLVLLDIGGQNQTLGAVQLSATSTNVTYAALVSAVDAYVDGYASAQKPSAPVIIALGTNNDLDVSAQTGADWATKVVTPVVTHSTTHTSVQIAGADDIEPGFSATVASSEAWLSGYLAETNAPFVFNGSADGCNSTQINGNCNNGWTAAELYWLSAGAAPTRMISLPQIYNNTMALQWKYISLTGINGAKPGVTFGGALTEHTACQQAGSCASLTGNVAWTDLWTALRSDARTTPASLPYSTDLRIN